MKEGDGGRRSGSAAGESEYGARRRRGSASEHSEAPTAGGAPAKPHPEIVLMPLPEGLQLRNYWSALKYICAFLTIITGAVSAVASKWQNEQKAPRVSGGPREPFQGALIQTVLMFVGEAIAYPFWYFDDMISRKQNLAPFFEYARDFLELRRPTVSWIWWPIAALHDMIGTFMVMIAQQNASNATVTMLRNTMVIGSAFAQMIYVRKALLFHEWLGIAVITVALVCFSVPDFTDAEDSEFTAAETGLGIGLTIVGTVIQTSQLLFEEWVFRKGRYSPTKAVAMEGFGGLFFCLVAYPIVHFTYENVHSSFYQIFNDTALLLITLMYLPIATAFNLAGIATTKLGGGVLRGVCYSVRAPIVWVINVAAGWQKYSTWSLMGTVVFLFGFMIYTSLLSQSLWAKPIHMCCTDPAMDGVDPGQELKKFMEEAEAAERAAQTAVEEGHGNNRRTASLQQN